MTPAYPLTTGTTETTRHYKLESSNWAHEPHDGITRKAIDTMLRLVYEILNPQLSSMRFCPSWALILRGLKATQSRDEKARKQIAGTGGMFGVGEALKSELSRTGAFKVSTISRYHHNLFLQTSSAIFCATIPQENQSSVIANRRLIRALSAISRRWPFPRPPLDPGGLCWRVILGTGLRLIALSILLHSPTTQGMGPENPEVRKVIHTTFRRAYYCT